MAERLLVDPAGFAIFNGRRSAIVAEKLQETQRNPPYFGEAGTRGSRLTRG
jgi:hypothetical protein